MGELSSGAEPADWSNIGPKQRITHQWSDTARGEKRFPVRDVLTNHSLIPADEFYEWVRHEVACVIVRRAPLDRTCHPIGSTLRGVAFRKRIVSKPSDNVS